MAVTEVYHAPHKAQFVVIDGDERDVGRRFVLEVGQQCVVGRALECDFVLADAKVSRRHARFECAPDKVVLIDLGSANGTVINGERIRQKVLDPGDYMRIGFTVLSFEQVPIVPERESPPA